MYLANGRNEQWWKSFSNTTKHTKMLSFAPGELNSSVRESWGLGGWVFFPFFFFKHLFFTSFYWSL